MSNLEVKNFIKLRNLFKDKGWDNNVGQDVTFESFGHLLYNLTPTEQNLFLELVERYLWIDFGKYIPLLAEILSEEKCVADLSSYKKLYFFPVIKPKDENKTKSGNLLIYMIQPVKQLIPKIIRDLDINVLENFEQISSDQLTVTDEDVIVLLDDFLGSGATVDSTLTKVLENGSIKPKNIRVLGFVALKQSIDLLKSKEITSYVKHVMGKAITDFYGDKAEEKLIIMRKIEKMSTAPNSFKLGFKKSEGLVTMARTPNNTFSIFWSKHRKDDIEFEAPFPR